jgi:taurine dioxygenase
MVTMRVIHAGPRQLRPTYSSEERRPYRRIAPVPLSPTIGAEIDGIALAEAMDDETFAEVHRALLEFKVIFFRDQDITPQQHVAFAARFGELETHPFVPHREGHPAVMVLKKNDRIGGYENVWHSDVTWRLQPSLGSVLLAREVPAVGGDTLFADMYAAYDGLDDDLREQIDGLRAVHDFSRTFGSFLSPEELAKKRQEFPPAEHPVVRTHPETGRKGLYVNAAFTSHIVGMPEAESDRLLGLLYRQATVPEYQCRFRWRRHSVAFWDNRAVQHYAASDYFPSRRLMERVAIVGDTPV